MLSGTASKFLVAVSGAISMTLTAYYGNAHWLPPVLAGMGALLVYLVPNSPGVPGALGRGTVTPVPPVTPITATKAGI